MTTTYDPHHPLYTDEADVRVELARVHDVCNGCRRCTDYCGSFPTLFEMLDRHDSADSLTPAAQDLVVGACFHCTLCAVGCPFGVGLHEAAVDVPALNLRARAMQKEHGHLDPRGGMAARVLARPDRTGRLVALLPQVVNRVVTAAPGSRRRRVLARLTGMTADRYLAPFTLERFSTWFAQRPSIRMQRRQAAVTLFPTCLVEHHATNIGKDLIKVYERNGVECDVAAPGCCGAPLLHAGDIVGFAKVARTNMARLAAQVTAGREIIVPDPACGHTLRVASLAHAANDDERRNAELVAAHTHDAADYLMTLHRGDDYVLDTDFEGARHERITSVPSSHVIAHGSGYPSRDLMRLTGALVEVAQVPAEAEGLWALRSGADANRVSDRVGPLIADAKGGIVASDSILSNLATGERSDGVPVHPLQLIARAYGIPEEP